MAATSRRLTVAILLITFVTAGCAHQRAPAPRSEPPTTRPAPSTTGTTTPGTSTTGSGASTDDRAGTLDPSEVITAEELATIPDPVPGRTAEPPVEATPPPRESTPSPPPTSDGTQTAWIWRVQIFASPDRAQAERTAREASDRLGEPHVIDQEGSLYKVRLGAFSKESDAEPLKRKAVIEGYTGAFRVRTASQ